MDPRRLLSLTAGGLLLSGCAVLRPDGPEPRPAAPVPAASADPAPAASAPPAGPSPMEPPDPERDAGDGGAALKPEIEQRPTEAASAGPDALISAHSPSPRRPTESGRAAIAAANAQARAPSRSDAFVGGIQIFAYDPGRVYEVWTAPLRVTTLTLAPGETVTSKAAGDTVRWQIGETTSGAGPGLRAHVLLKPLERGLETNLVLTTSQRVYLLQLRSGPPEGFNAAVAWDLGAVIPPPDGSAPGGDGGREAPPPAALDTPDARYRITPRGRAPRWTPTTVFNDGVRTFIAFAPDLPADEAPALFVVAPDGESQMVNYRQQGGLFVVDRVFERAELRLGDRRPQVVRIERLGSGRGGRP